MAFDAHKNLAIASVVTAPTPPTSGTSITVGAGEGARFPAVPFNGTVWPADMAPDPTTAEVWRCTARAGDVLTLVRAQEGTTARAIVAGDLIAATITAKSLTDIESGVNFPQLATAGDLVFSGAAVTKFIRTATADGADNQAIYITPAGTIGDDRGARLSLQGNETAAGGNISLVAGNTATGKIEFYTGASAVRGVIHPSGGFSWGGTTDPGAGNLSVSGLMLSRTGPAHDINLLTADGADTDYLRLGSGGAPTSDRGASINLHGNEVTGPGGSIDFVAGNTPTGTMSFYTGPTTIRGRIHASGGFSWGGTSDPGAANMFVGTGLLPPFSPRLAVSFNATTQPGFGLATTADSAAGSFLVFFNAANNIQGKIGSPTANTVSYETTSDARLKTPLNRHTDPSVLRDTVIHNFIWNADGTAGRGVFAQEAALVAPFAVSVGSDEVDAEGRLSKPWGVDYSKYVPDLIVGWQQHTTRLDALQDHVARLTQAHAPAVPTPRPLWVGLYQRVCVWLSAWWTPVEITP